MADHPPPDTKRGPGKKRGGKSGKVADFRYKRPSRPDGKRSDRRNPPRRDAGFAARAPGFANRRPAPDAPPAFQTASDLSRRAETSWLDVGGQRFVENFLVSHYYD